MKFKAKELKELVREEETDNLRIVEDGDYISDGKYERSTVIFTNGYSHFRLDLHRSGSPFTDWYYSWEDWGEEVECPEVEKQEVVKVVWKVKK